MKKYLILLSIAFYTLECQAQKITTATPYITKSLSGEAISGINVKTSGGSISVEGNHTADARLEVFVTQNNRGNYLSKEEIEKRLAQDYILEIAVNNHQLTALAKPKSGSMNWKKALNISFVVYASSNVSTELSTSGGSISLQNISGNQRFATSGGSLSIDGLAGNVKGRTSGGSISLKNSRDNLDLSTSGGSITAKNCKGDIHLNTSGGSLQLSDLNGTIEAHTSGGSINAKSIMGELVSSTSGGSINMSDMMCSLQTSTSGGTISVEIKQLGKYLTIKNAGGDINLKMPANKGANLDLSARKINTGSLKNFDGKMADDHVDGALNGGGIPVKVKASSGKINLTIL